MTITTEEAERLAKTCDIVEAPPDIAAALRSLAAERDALRANLDAIVIPTTYYMDPPDGGDVSIAEQVRRMYRHVCDLQAENARLRKLAAYLAGTNTDHVQVALAGNPIVCDAIQAEARAALGETQ
jgi:hypothetical protein